MDFDKFVQQAREALQSQFPDMQFDIRSVEKLQGESYTGITMTPAGSNIGATLNMNRSFEAMENGSPFAAVMNNIFIAAEQAIQQMPSYDPHTLADYDQMRGKLVMQVIPTAENQEMLVGIPHRDIEDMSVVYRFQLESTEQGSASILVTNQMLNIFGITTEQLMQDAAEVAPEQHPATIRTMAEVLNEMMGMEIVPPDEAGMWVASIADGVNGAGVIAYPDFMDQAAEKLGGDFFLLPSSVHEVLLIPDHGQMTAQELSEMVASVNASDVQPSDRLSDVAYHYDADARIFETAYSFEARMNERDAVLADAMPEMEQPETMTVLLVEPGAHPEQVEIGTDLKSLQQAVAGNIEVVYPFDDNVGLVVNEEGKIHGLPLNRALRDEDGEVYDILAGSFLVVGLTEDNFGSLTPDQLQHYEEASHQPEVFIKMGRGIIALPIPEEAVVKEAAKSAEKAIEQAAGIKLKKKADPEH